MYKITTLLSATCLLFAFDVENGDLVFQSLPHGAVVDAIESSTRSAYSHCGIVVKKDGRTLVLEAIGPVKETEYDEWVKSGREEKVSVYRMRDPRYIPKMIEEGYKFLGRPYDIRYRMDDEKIYCSELIYKSVFNAHGKKMSRINKLGELDWVKILPVIIAIEGDSVPLEREMITPVSLTRSTMVKLVYTNYPEIEGCR